MTILQFEKLKYLSYELIIKIEKIMEKFISL